MLVGVIWAGWHAPIILLGYDYDGDSRPVAMLLLTGFCVLFGTLLAWLRIRTDSAIPAAVAHGTFNGWMRLVPMLVAVGQPANLGTASPMGLLGYAAFGALAVWLLSRPRWTAEIGEGHGGLDQARRSPAAGRLQTEGAELVQLRNRGVTPPKLVVVTKLAARRLQVYTHALDDQESLGQTRRAVAGRAARGRRRTQRNSPGPQTC